MRWLSISSLKNQADGAVGKVFLAAITIHDERHDYVIIAVKKTGVDVVELDIANITVVRHLDDSEIVWMQDERFVRDQNPDLWRELEKRYPVLDSSAGALLRFIRKNIRRRKAV